MIQVVYQSYSTEGGGQQAVLTPLRSSVNHQFGGAGTAIAANCSCSGAVQLSCSYSYSYSSSMQLQLCSAVELQLQWCSSSYSSSLFLLASSLPTVGCLHQHFYMDRENIQGFIASGRRKYSNYYFLQIFMGKENSAVLFINPTLKNGQHNIVFHYI